MQSHHSAPPPAQTRHTQHHHTWMPHAHRMHLGALPSCLLLEMGAPPLQRHSCIQGHRWAVEIAREGGHLSTANHNNILLCMRAYRSGMWVGVGGVGVHMCGCVFRVCGGACSVVMLIIHLFGHSAPLLFLCCLYDSYTLHTLKPHTYTTFYNLHPPYTPPTHTLHTPYTHPTHALHTPCTHPAHTLHAPYTHPTQACRARATSSTAPGRPPTAAGTRCTDIPFLQQKQHSSLQQKRHSSLQQKQHSSLQQKQHSSLLYNSSNHGWWY